MNDANAYWVFMGGIIALAIVWMAVAWFFAQPWAIPTVLLACFVALGGLVLWFRSTS